MIYLKHATNSQEIPLGYFLDSTDGNTEETGLTIANTDLKIWKTGATTLANKNSGGATHISNGIYYAVLDSTDTDTIGPMRIHCHVSGALAVILNCVVLDENVFDVMFGTTAPSTLAAGALMGLADDAITAAKIDTGAIVAATFAAGAIDAAAIADNAIDLATFAADCKTGSALKANVETVTNGAITAAAIATGAIDADALATDAVAEIVDGVWDEAIAGHSGVGSTGAVLAAAGGSGDPWATALPGAYGAGTAGKIIGDNINAPIDAILDDAVDGSTTARQAFRLMMSALLGKVSGAPSGPLVFRDINDTKDRITGVIDTNGNRTSVTLDGS